MTDQQQHFIDTFASKYGLNVKRTCEAVGISRQTYYNWIDTLDTFAAEVDEAREGLKDDVESVMYSLMVDERNVPLLIHFSKTKMRDRGYGDYKTVKNDSELQGGYLKIIRKSMNLEDATRVYEENLKNIGEQHD